MIIIELRTPKGRKINAIVGLVLAGLSFCDPIFNIDVFSDGENICLILASAFWGLCTIFGSMTANSRFVSVLCEFSFYITIVILVGVTISIYT